jgi:signal transduction histidine kinase
MNLKLKNRIAFYYLTASAVLTAVLFIIIYALIRNTVYNHLEEELNIESKEVQRGLVVGQDSVTLVNLYEWEEREHGQVEVNPTFIEIIDRNHNLIKKTDNLLDKNLEFIPEINEIIYLDTKLSDKLVREVQIPLVNQGGAVMGYLMIGVPMEEAGLILGKLGWVLSIGFLAALMILFVLTRWLAEKSISPIHTVTSTAEKITKENLDERIKLPPNKDEIFTLTATINSLLDRLEDAVLREKQFTADASHELRTPLSVIKGTLEVLIRRKRDTEHYEEKISYCINEVDRMTNIIDQLLLLARYESGKIEPQTREIDLNENINYAVMMMDTTAKEKGISINFDDNRKYTVKADPSMLDVILQNLLSNSIKYSNGSKKIEIRIEQKENKILCSIKDYGIGMNKDEISRIFDRFYRGTEARNAHHAGDGIGLAIVKRLADLQNLIISYESEPAKGTTATITFDAP